MIEPWASKEIHRGCNHAHPTYRELKSTCILKSLVSVASAAVRLSHTHMPCREVICLCGRLLLSQAAMPGVSWGRYNGCEETPYPLLRGFRVDFLVLEGEGAAHARVRSCSSSFTRCLYLDDCLMRLISCKKKRPHACERGMSEVQ